MFKTIYLQDIICTSKTGDINVTNYNLFQYIPTLIPSVETQFLYNEAIQNNYKLSIDEWYTEKRVISVLLVQHDIGSRQQVNSPKFLIRALQTKNRNDKHNKNMSKAKFDNLNLRKYFVELDSTRYLRDGVSINYTENDYIDQYRDLKLFFFREYLGEPILNPLVTYPDMITKFSIGIMDLRHRPDYITPKKIQLFREYATDPDNARLFLTLNRRREIELK